MSLAALLRSLESDTDARVEQLVADATAEAAREVALAITGLARQREETVRRREAELRGELSRGIAAHAEQVEREVLTARDEALARVFERARALMPRLLTDPGMAQRIADTIPLALRHLPQAEAVVRAPGALAPALAPLLAGMPVTLTHDDVGTGALVAAADGSCEVNLTLEGWLERRRAELAITVLAAIEGDA